MTKAEQIRGLLEFKSLSVGEIANIVGCMPEYVRATRRRMRKEVRDQEQEYRTNRYRTDPGYRAKKSKWNRTYKARQKQLQATS